MTRHQRPTVDWCAGIVRFRAPGNSHRSLSSPGSQTRTYSLIMVTSRKTRPYRPQTNGKVERFNRTLTEEWAYTQTYLSNQARAATYQDWIHHYNHHRPHTGIGGKSPIERLSVHNLPGNYS